MQGCFSDTATGAVVGFSAALNDTSGALSGTVTVIPYGTFPVTGSYSCPGSPSCAPFGEFSVSQGGIFGVSVNGCLSFEADLWGTYTGGLGSGTLTGGPCP
jgi:hypothetical protein